MKLDIGCGKNKRDGYIGMDSIYFPGVDIVHDARVTPWPIESDSVEHIHCSHFLEHLTNLGDKWERVRFFNEAYRVLKKGAEITIILPHWASNRYYGDPTHKEPWSEMAFNYLDRDWRKANAPHADSEFVPGMYDCHFHCTWNYNLNGALANRHPEYQLYAVNWYREAATDMVATVKKS